MSDENRLLKHAELRAYKPTLRDQIATWLMGDERSSPARNRLIEGVMGSRGLGSTGMGLVDLTPAGAPLWKQELDEASSAGDAVLAAANFIPAAKMAGMAAKTIASNADGLSSASRSARIYDPPKKPQRAFAEDYKAGTPADAEGNLTHDIEGRPLTARYVAGRRTAGGDDVGLTPEEINAVAEALIGNVPESVPQSQLRRGTVGGYAVGRAGSGGYDRAIGVLDTLAPDDWNRVAAHETGHAIGDLSGKYLRSENGVPVHEIPIDGLKKQAGTVYNDLNNPELRRARDRRPGVDPRKVPMGTGWTPESNGYRPDQSHEEYMAEARRAYMADPNYIKTVAPDLAERIRKYVNEHPEVSKVVQFNALGLPIALNPLLRSGEWSESEPELY